MGLELLGDIDLQYLSNIKFSNNNNNNNNNNNKLLMNLMMLFLANILRNL